jgi:AraC-like DNA-binding protein
MTTDIIEINNYIVLIEQSDDEKTIIEKCDLFDQVVGFSFYGSGEVELSVGSGSSAKVFKNTTGMATSFFGNKHVEFSHKISHKKPLQCISVFSTIKNIKKQPATEREVYNAQLKPLLYPEKDFVEGPYFYMTPNMRTAVTKVFSNTYSGSTRTLFLKSQITELLAHFFAQLLENENGEISKADQEKLYSAKEIISNNIEAPPSLSEISKLIGLNNTKLKKNFKQLFGVPVFKYLQNERLAKAYDMLISGNLGIQETAWFVGYTSLSSFSNAFHKKFGVRPSDVKK